MIFKSVRLISMLILLGSVVLNSNLSFGCELLPVTPLECRKLEGTAKHRDGHIMRELGISIIMWNNPFEAFMEIKIYKNNKMKGDPTSLGLYYGERQYERNAVKYVVTKTNNGDSKMYDPYLKDYTEVLFSTDLSSCTGSIRGMYVTAISAPISEIEKNDFGNDYAEYLTHILYPDAKSGVYTRSVMNDNIKIVRYNNKEFVMLIHQNGTPLLFAEASSLWYTRFNSYLNTDIRKEDLHLIVKEIENKVNFICLQTQSPIEEMYIYPVVNSDLTNTSLSSEGRTWMHILRRFRDKEYSLIDSDEIMAEMNERRMLEQKQSRKIEDSLKISIQSKIEGHYHQELKGCTCEGERNGKLLVSEKQVLNLHFSRFNEKFVNRGHSSFKQFDNTLENRLFFDEGISVNGIGFPNTRLRFQTFQSGHLKEEIGFGYMLRMASMNSAKWERSFVFLEDNNSVIYLAEFNYHPVNKAAAKNYPDSERCPYILYSKLIEYDSDKIQSSSFIPEKWNPLQDEEFDLETEELSNEDYSPELINIYNGNFNKNGHIDSLDGLSRYVIRIFLRNIGLGYGNYDLMNPRFPAVFTTLEDRSHFVYVPLVGYTSEWNKEVQPHRFEVEAKFKDFIEEYVQGREFTQSDDFHVNKFLKEYPSSTKEFLRMYENLYRRANNLPPITIVD